MRFEIPQVSEAAEPFLWRLFPRGTKLLRTEPLKAIVIGAFVRGLSMRDVDENCVHDQSLPRVAPVGQVSLAGLAPTPRRSERTGAVAHGYEIETSEARSSLIRASISGWRPSRANQFHSSSA